MNLIGRWVSEHPLLAVVAALAVAELLYVLAQAAFALAVSHPPYRGVRLRYIAFMLAFARRSTITNLVARLFPISAVAKHDNRIAAAWRLWHRAHIPPYVVLQLRRWPSRQATIIEAIFDGFAIAVARTIDQQEPPTPGDPPRMTFEDFWPILECIEELAVHTDERNHGQFAAALADFAAAVNDESVCSQLGWVVNELLERTDAEKRLAHAIADALLTRDTPASHEALRTLVAYKKRTPGGLDADIEKLDAKIKPLSPLASPDEVKLNERWENARRDLISIEASSVETKVTRIVEELSAAEAAARIVQACDGLLEKATPRSGSVGLVALAALRLVLGAFCRALGERKGGPEQPGGEKLAQSVCEALMRRSQSGISPFIMVEALETIRDHRPAETASAMAAFLGRSHGEFDSGIAVCMCEGVEEKLPALATTRIRVPRFRWSAGQWHGEPDEATFGAIVSFWRYAAPRFRRSPDHDVPQWMNVRLRLRHWTRKGAPKWPARSLPSS